MRAHTRFTVAIDVALYYRLTSPKAIDDFDAERAPPHAIAADGLAHAAV